MITLKELLESASTKKYTENDLPQDVLINIHKLLEILQEFRAIYGKPMIPTCSYRDAEHNKKIGGSPKSDHSRGLAADFQDANGELRKFFMENREVMEKLGIWIEHPAYTGNWCHIGIAPKQQRAFIPFAGAKVKNTMFDPNQQPKYKNS